MKKKLLEFAGVLDKKEAEEIEREITAGRARSRRRAKRIFAELEEVD